MTKGFTDVVLVGGKSDGLTFECASMRVPEKVSVPSKYHFVEDNKGNVSICELKGKPHKNWTMYTEEIYVKQEKKKHELGVTFEYSHINEVERCEQKTQKGQRCLNPSENQKKVCKTHKEKTPA